MLVSSLRIFTALVVAAVGVSAQNACILGCVQQSESPSTCTSYTNRNCVCSNQVFQKAASDCIKAKCTDEDMKSALGLQQKECGGGSSSSSSEAE